MGAAGSYPAEIYMGLMESLLLILGVVIFIISFIVPEKLGKENVAEAKIPEGKIQELIQKEIKRAEFQIEEKTEETITAATEKAERYMERISNEKIMAVQEYSDTVLGQINRNHEEAVFLYDMLNNKHIQIKNTAAEMESKVENKKSESGYTDTEPVTGEQGEEMFYDEEPEDIKSLIAAELLDMDYEMESVSDVSNNKDKILMYHQEGKSNIEIAKALGLGIGEVKLVIGLYENAES